MSAHRDRFDDGRRDMIGAFVRLSDLARRLAVDEDEISEIHGRFFDGNIAIKAAFGAAVLLREIGQTGETTPR